MEFENFKHYMIDDGIEKSIFEYRYGDVVFTSGFKSDIRVYIKSVKQHNSSEIKIYGPIEDMNVDGYFTI